MTARRVAVELHGEWVPVEECAWFLTAPCGCCQGYVLADMSDYLILTEGQFIHEFFGSFDKAHEKANAGFTWWFGEFPAEGVTGCHHDPKWVA